MNYFHPEAFWCSRTLTFTSLNVNLNKKNTMKKIAAYMLASALIALGSSCKKEQDETITKTFQVSLSPGQTYTTQVAQAGDEDDVLKITQQASHASLSEIAAISGSKDMTFTYVPAPQYTGTDEVHISGMEGEHNGNGGGHGKCSGHHDDQTTVYVYKFTIGGDNH
jgi:hypothetical protein